MIFVNFFIEINAGTAAQGQLNLKTTILQLDYTQFLSLAYTLLRLSNLFSRHNKLVSTGMYELLRPSKILLHNILVHKSKAQNYFTIVE